MKTNIGTCLYVKNSVDAVEMYKKAFGLQLGYNVLNDDGSYYHSELYKDGVEWLSVVEACPDAGKAGSTTQICVIFDNADDVRAAFELLSKDGVIDMDICELPWSPCAASVVDRFNVWWYLSAPQHKPNDEWRP